MRILSTLILLELIWHIQSWCLKTILSINFQINQVDWAPDNSIFVVASKDDDILRIFSAKSYQLLKVYNNSGSQPTSVKISKNSAYIGIGYANDDLVLLHNAAPSFSEYHTFSTTHGNLKQIDFSFDNTSVLSCGTDQRIKVWDIAGKSGPTFNFKGSPPKQALGCRYNSAGNAIFYDNDKRVRHINLLANPVSQSNISQYADDSLQADFLYNSNFAVSVVKDKTLRFSNSFWTASYTDTVAIMNTIGVGKSGKYMAYGGDSKILRIVNQTNNNLITKFFSKDRISSVRFSSDQENLIMGDVSGQIRIYSSKCGFFKCQSGQYNDTNVCKKCSSAKSFCITCKSAAACQTCMAGFYPSSGNCVACYTTLSNCLACKDGNQCLKCLDGFYLDSSTKKCVKCSLNGCIQCNTSAICTKCFKNDFYLDTTNNNCKQCTDTLSNCVRCYNDSVCVDCQIGFYQHSGTKKCVQCPGNCLACQSATNCTQCKVGYWTNAGTCTTRCTATGCIACNITGHCYDCKQGMFLTGTNTCTSCTNPCSTCSVAAANCTGCNIGYYLDAVNYNCIKCIQNCKICNESAKCLSCFPGFKLDGTSFTCKPCINYYGNCSQCSQTQCLKCRQGFYTDTTTATYVCKTCISVIPNCLQCANNTNCVQCITSYYLTSSTGINSCAPCAAGCQQCITLGNCTNCFTTYFKNSSLQCQPCKNKCFECTGQFTCTSCVVGYYLDVITCKACQSILAFCSECTDANTCIVCMPGAYLDTDNKCKLCSLSNCLTCNKTDCFSCQVGYYLDTSATPYSCKRCSTFCQQCTSSSVCSSCIDGYYFDSADNKCKSCAATFPHCTSCNKTKCLQCDLGTQLNTTNNNQCSPCSNHITNCKMCFWDNVPATPIIKCSQCNYGFGLASNSLSCPACNLIRGCIECKSATACTKCEIGYFLKNDNTCGLCKQNCLTCNNALSCLSCQLGYVNDTTNCVLCQTKIGGCSKCIVDTATTYNCSLCQIGYYLQATDKQCYICHQKMSGCYTCNDSTTCTGCLDKYYIDVATHSCKKCVTNLAGCQLCNSSSICIACQDSYYLDATDHKCYFCSNNIAGCLHCKSNTVCSQCESGYYLTAGNVCNLCQSTLEGCIYCNSNTYCIQCRTGYYLDTTDNKCKKCAQPGCQVCSQSSPSVCVTCNSKYYLVATGCNTCRSRVTYCDQCNTTDCLSCQVGYYLASPTLCSTCSSTMSGCSRCSNGLTCLQCMSSYFVNSTNQCQQCNKVMFGCQNCINGSTCISCQANFFLNSTTDKCQPCMDIQGCMLCRDQITCVMCQQKYYMVGTQCKLCKQAMKGCFSCASDSVCVQCQSGYVLDPVSYKCTVNTVQAKQAVQGLKLVSYYISKYMLKHILMAKGTTFKKDDNLNITASGATSLFVQDYTGKEVQLKILSYEYAANGYSLIFYTDNPLSDTLASKQKKMSFRRLLGQAMQINLQVMVKMNQDVYNQILPQLDYKGAMTIGYSLNNPQFVNSYMAAESGNKYFMYQIVGMVAIILFLINYAVKFLWTMPQSRNRSTLLPHIIALKSCCLILYPAHFEYISFCKGFMIVDFPWLNNQISTVLTDLSDNVQVPFGTFFQNMSLAGTFLLGLGVYILSVILVQIYFYLANQQDQQQKGSQKQSDLSSQQQRKRQKEFKIQKIQDAIGVNYDNDQSQTNKYVLRKRSILQLLSAIFSFSMVYYASVSVQGAFYNYLQVITINGVFYILGMLLFIYVTIQTFYAFARNFKNIHKVRIYIKACLLSIAHLNPIYVVSVAVAFDIILAVLQFYLVNKRNQFSKYFVLTHILSSICIILMIFVSGSLISLLASAVCLVICLGFQIFIHVRQYFNAKRNLNDQEFKIQEQQEKQQEQANDQPNRRQNIWDFGKKLTPSNTRPKKDIDMYATMQAFDNSNNFQMQNMDFYRSNGFRPQTTLNKNSQTSGVIPIKQGGRRNRNRKTQQGFKSNVIQILPHPMDQKDKQKRVAPKFSLEQMDSNSS